MTDKKVEYLRWLGDPEAVKVPNVNRHLLDVEFNGPDHVGRVEGADKIKFFTEGKWAEYFEPVSKEEYEVNGGKDPEADILTEVVGEDANAPKSGGSTGSGSGTASGGNGSSTSTGTL